MKKVRAPLGQVPRRTEFIPFPRISFRTNWSLNGLNSVLRQVHGRFPDHATRFNAPWRNFQPGGPPCPPHTGNTGPRGRNASRCHQQPNCQRRGLGGSVVSCQLSVEMTARRCVARKNNGPRTTDNGPPTTDYPRSRRRRHHQASNGARTTRPNCHGFVLRDR
jgi:hypothetical protein